MSKKRILIVEDEIIIAKDIERMLGKLDLEVAGVCATGEEAVNFAGTGGLDLVLMDIRLEGANLDGIQAADAIRRDTDVPVIFLTSHADQATLDRAKITGPTGYIVKPVSLTDLSVSIEVGLHKAEMDRKLSESQRWLGNVMRCVGDAIIVADENGRVKNLNREAERVTGWSNSEVQNLDIEHVFCLVDPAGNRRFSDPLLEVLQGEVKRELSDDVFLRTREQALAPIEYTASALRDERDKFVGLVLAFRDVTERRAVQAERERLIRELKESLATVKTLRGLLPICSNCKSVRKDDGFWEKVEEYLEDHTDATMSHGMCPDCTRKLYPDMADEVLSDAATEFEERRDASDD